MIFKMCFIVACMLLAHSAPAVAQKSALPANYSGLSESNWAHYLGDRSFSQYSRLAQINKKNVSQLKTAWTYKASEGALSSF